MKKTVLVVGCVFLIAGLAGCGEGGGGGKQYPRFAGGDNEIIDFSFPASLNASLGGDVSGVISGDTISLTVPHSVPVDSLVADYLTNSVTVEVNGVVQSRGITANDFGSPVVYRVIADNGDTQDYTVTVGRAPSPEKRISSFSINGVDGSIDADAGTIALDLPAGTGQSSLVALFSAAGKSVTVNGVVQTSGKSANDFTRPVTYTVVAYDGSMRDYAVTVRILPAPWKEITSFAFLADGNPGLGIDVPGVIDNSDISVVLPHGSDPTALVASYATTGKSVTVKGEIQESGVSPNDYSAPLAFLVAAEDGSTREYLVAATIAKSDAKSITRYQLDGEPGLIDESARSIRVDLPAGKNLSKLTASFVTTGVLVTVDGREQKSGLTQNNFSGPVHYDVTADDGSVQSYVVEARRTEELAGLWNFEYPADGEYLISGARPVEGLFGNALFFDGRGDYMLVPDSDRLTLADAGSIEVFLKVLSLRDYAGIVHKGVKTDFSDETYTLQLWGKDGTLRLGIFNEKGQWAYVDAARKLENGEWYHIVATWNSSDLAIYMNGKLEGTVKNTVGAVRDSAGGLVIGAQLDKKYNSTYGNLGFHGIFDRVALYASAMNAEEVANRYAVYEAAGGTALTAYLLSAPSRNTSLVVTSLLGVIALLVLVSVYNRRRMRSAG
ncbi:MAG TPA: LamG-like jellyroll fold domain-containing protein [Spirochaetota bacterium]|nr:LamG-like jellyroll fold domain-containing protein [Spirochaetota bacterium]